MSTGTAAEPTLEQLAAQEKADEQKASQDAPPSEPAPSSEAIETTTEEGATDDATAISAERLKWLEEQTGYKLSDRYKSDEEMAEGIKQAFRLLGQRDEDANFGRTLRGRLTEDQIQRLLAEDKGKADSSKTADSEPELPVTYQEYELLLEKARQAQDENDPNLIRAKQFVRAVAQRNFQVAREFVGLKKELADLKQSLSTQQASFQARTEEQKVNDWMVAHRDEFWQKDDPSKLTAFGQQVASAFDNDPFLQDETPGLKRWEIAYRTAKANQPAVKPTRAVTKTAITEPSTRKITKLATLDELMSQMIEKIGDNREAKAKALELYNEQCLAQEASR